MSPNAGGGVAGYSCAHGALINLEDLGGGAGKRGVAHTESHEISHEESGGSKE